VSTLTDFLFANTSWAEADLFAITLPNGTVLRATSAQMDLVYGGNTFYSTKYGKWERGPVKFDLNAVNEIDLFVTASQTVLFPGASVLPLIQGTKLFARATVEILVAYSALTDPTTIIGVTSIFFGHLTLPTASSTQAIFKCSDMLWLLNEPWPRRVITAGCPFTVFDHDCGLDRAAYAVSGAVGAGSTQTALVLGKNKNLLIKSEQFDSIAWTLGGGSVAADTIVDPNGGMTADAFTFTGGSPPLSGFYQQAVASPAVGTPFTFSVWLKASSGSPSINLRVDDIFGSRTAVSTAFVLSQTWQRFSVSGVVASGATALTALVYNATDQSKIYHVWGAQFELAAAPTAYAKTTVATSLALGSVGTDTLPYTKGYIVPTSGEAAGWPIMVTEQIDSTHIHLAPFLLPLNVGDGFTLYPGCDQKSVTCLNKYVNLGRYGGFIAVPGPPAAMSGTGG